MSKYSELADKMDLVSRAICDAWVPDFGTIDHEIFCSLAAAALRELEAERDRLREALVEIINTPNKSEGESAETLATMMQDIAFAALESKP